MELSFGLMEVNMRESSKTTILMGLGIMCGWMGGSMKDRGRTTKCMGVVFSFGQMAENTKESM
jgi:hypothetical protein